MAGRWLRATVAAASVSVALAACAGGERGPEPPRTGESAAAPVVESIARADAAIALRGDDGTPIHLRRLAVRGQVDGFLGMTELDMVFENHEGRVLDGRLAVDLPEGARVVRFAIQEDKGWREAEVVPRRAAYESLVDEVMEPALLTDGAVGDRLLVRLPRIPYGELRVVVGYVEELRGREKPYRLPLAGLPRVEQLEVRVTGADLHARGPGELKQLADGRSLFAFRGRGQVDSDIVIHAPELRSRGIRHENRVIARVAPIPHDHSDPITSLTVLFDTSASQSLGFDAQIQRLEELLAALHEWSAEDIPLRVICFDQGAETVFEGRISDFNERHLAAIKRRGALGASDLIGALRYAGAQPSRAYGRLVVFTDGVITAGAGHVEAIRGEVTRLAEVGVQRVDVLGLGVGGREPLLAAIARADLDRDGVILRADVAPELALRKLLHHVVSGVEVKVPGSKWVYPERIDGIQADDTVLVYAEIADDGPFDIVFDGAIRARPTVTTVDSGAPPLLENAWNAARVRWMEEQLDACDGEFCAKWRRRITDESIAHRLVNDATALVMLGDGDERRFGLDPSVPAGLLAFGRDGATLRARVPRDELRGRRASAHALVPDPVLPDMHRAEVASAEVTDTSGRPTAPPGAARAPMGIPDIAPKPRISAASLIDSAIEETPRDKPQVGPLRRPKDAYDGALLTVMDSLRIGDPRSAQRRAEVWRSEEPASVLALVALGEALEANGDTEAAARAYGSIIDLFPMRPEMRRLAAARLERIGQVTRWLVLDSYGRALRKQSDDPSSHRLLGYALLRSGYYREAFEVMVSGFAWARASATSQTMARVLYDDIGLVAAAWIAARPEDEEFVRASLEVQEIELQTEPSLRFVLTWDTPISDVDLHVRDGDGRHAFYKNRELVSGGRLYGDVATGRGIEAFVIDGAPEAFPYNLQIGYYTLDPLLGYGMGKVEVIEHDGRGKLTFDQRPFVVSRDGGTVDLGLIAEAPSAAE